MNSYDYFLPSNLVAQAPAVPRDSSKLFVYDIAKDSIVFDRFVNLDKYLPADSFLVLNNTRVMPARVELRKKTGGKITALLLLNELVEKRMRKEEARVKNNDNIIKAMVDRKVRVGEKLFIDKSHFFEVDDQKEKIFYLRFDFSQEFLMEKLLKIGQTPVPLYLKKTPLKEKQLRKKYQAVFAQSTPSRCGIGSVAAPTASLHFTQRLFKRLEKKGIERYFITLHVGLGTFAPVTKENIKEKKLHEEYYEIDRDLWKLIETKKRAGKKLVAVGTTVVRTLESFAKLKNQSSNLKSTSPTPKLFNKTDLFIYPSYQFQMVDILITNFHLPRSSLMMLVEAFLQFKKAKRHLVDLYQIAIKNRFCFYSFGDGMVVI